MLRNLIKLKLFPIKTFRTGCSYMNKENVCPILQDPNTYNPDTIDLLQDSEAREYWLKCLVEMVDGFVEKGKLLNPHRDDITEILKKCREQFHNYIEEIQNQSKIIKPLSVRTLLDIQDQILEENGINDLWEYQKEKETKEAFSQFKQQIKIIDELPNFCEKWTQLFTGLVAGNMFDWGAKAVTEILEKSGNIGLTLALKNIQQRPWFIDDAERFIQRIKVRPYQKILIFVDNAGVDFVLGVLPFLRQFLIEGTSVYIAANSNPSLNDVTFNDLQVYLHTACKECNVIAQSMKNYKLVGVDSGQRGPCLNLRTLNPVANALLERVDLVILEGMGRAVHTNYNEKFKIDCLKIAVLKNEWLAKYLGAKQFSVVFKYEECS